MDTDRTILVTHPVPGVKLLTLNRPEVLNAIDMQMAAQLSDILDSAAKDDNLRCLVVTGAGDRAFSAGFDIHEMAEFDATAMREAFVKRDPLFLQIAQHPLSIIAALNGLAYGAGALIAAACDFRIAGPATRFKVTAVDYGSANATWSLPRIVGIPRAKDILMTGRVIDATEGFQLGLFDRVAQKATVLAEAFELATAIAAKPRLATSEIKELINAGSPLTAAEGWQAEHNRMLRSFENAGQSGATVFDRFLSNRA